MACIGPYTCARCNEVCTEIVSRDRVCSVCRKAETEAKSRQRRVDLHGLTALTPGERLARLEEMTYELADLRRRVEVLEAANTRY